MDHSSSPWTGKHIPLRGGPPPSRRFLIWDENPIRSGRRSGERGGSARVIFSKTMASRITIEPGKRSGQPCIRGLRITIWDVLNWLAAGMTERQILDDYPELESDDFRAVYEFAAKMGKRVAL